VGGGARIVTAQVQQSGAGTLLTMTGFAPEAGALFMPTGQQWRVGVTVRAPVNTGVNIFGLTTGNPIGRAGNFILPDRVLLPWEIEAGVAYQLGPRPLNPGWQNPHEQEGWLRRRIAADRARREQENAAAIAQAPLDRRAAVRAEIAAEEKSLRAIEDQRLDAEVERLKLARRARYANWPREKILLLASVLVTGPTTSGSEVAVSLEGFLDQRAEIVGKQASVTPRLGIEGEPVRDRVELRVGTYVEPSRYDTGTPRQHFTFGGDIRLFPLDFWGLLPEANWKIGLFVDVSARYINGGIGIGEWH
jgi:hypothetical protein